MSAVGVLAVLDALNGNTPSLRLDADVKRARAAVAELMDAARLVLRFHDVCVKNGQFNLTFDQERALRAALARCKGGAT